ncbi:MAG: FixH family protein [Gammaproteobacteria bacterium]|nr:FixH family protein [Gammaproteobacteria bacterium]
MNISQSNKEALKNPWVLAIILFVLTFVSMNAVFIYLAFQSPPSLVDKNFYENGENYEQIQKKIKQQKALGWSGAFFIPTKTRVNQTQKYEVLLQGKNSTSLALDSVMIKAYRPSDAKADFSASMTNSKPGMYETELSFNLPGTWDLVVEAVEGGKEFVMHKRITIAP